MSDQKDVLSAHDHGNCELCDQIERELETARKGQRDSDIELLKEKGRRLNDEATRSIHAAQGHITIRSERAKAEALIVFACADLLDGAALSHRAEVKP